MSNFLLRSIRRSRKGERSEIFAATRSWGDRWHDMPSMESGIMRINKKISMPIERFSRKSCDFHGCRIQMRNKVSKRMPIILSAALALVPYTIMAAQPPDIPQAPPSPSAMKPQSGNSTDQKRKTVPPSEKLPDWPQLKRDQVSPTPKPPLKMRPASPEEIKRAHNPAPGGIPPDQRPH
ncbi:hypothetical protein [Nguyenibacter sp. L1]|uniref:hypothetical protein n=1 Tax=Nguyenibacter sp. L1 TaxID=3049350 RepID=UPI002B4A86C4|nr:hypothetical protein [Nguyenibacter sp. L1]WRH89145.1 hypothetical protein QN315_05830 [Nguyenibacter sp. L1]